MQGMFEKYSKQIALKIMQLTNKQNQNSQGKVFKKNECSTGNKCEAAQKEVANLAGARKNPERSVWLPKKTAESVF